MPSKRGVARSLAVVGFVVLSCLWRLAKLTQSPPRLRRIFDALPLTLLLGFTAVSHAQTPTAVAPAKAAVKAAAPVTWETLRAAYKTDTAPVDVKEESLADTEFTRVHLTFTDAKGQRVTGLLLRPRGSTACPVALLLHGLGSDKDTMIRGFAPSLVKRGIACFALDADLHGERKVEGRSPSEGLTFAQVVRVTVADYRQALTYLQTRKDVDAKHIGLLGYSMGAMTGAIVAGVDERVGAAVLCVGGDPIRPLIPTLPEIMRPLAETVSPSNYVGHISPRPVFFINGKQDTTMPEAVVLPYLAAAHEPKTSVWVESGHLLPPTALKQGLDWLTKKLTPKVTATKDAINHVP